MCFPGKDTVHYDRQKERVKQIMVRVYAIDPKPKPVLFCHIILLYRKKYPCNSMLYANGSIVFSQKETPKTCIVNDNECI